VNGSCKHSSLLRYGNNYGTKKSYSTGPRRIFNVSLIPNGIKNEWRDRRQADDQDDRQRFLSTTNSRKKNSIRQHFLVNFEIFILVTLQSGKMRVLLLIVLFNAGVVFGGSPAMQYNQYKYVGFRNTWHDGVAHEVHFLFKTLPNRFGSLYFTHGPATMELFTIPSYYAV